MKKRLAVALAVVSISATATVALGGMQAGTGINGSWHDLNSDANQGRNYKKDALKRTCVFCHTPHNARTNDKDGQSPLWNHKDTATVLDAYRWISPANGAKNTDGTRKIPIADPLVGPSRLCMACHDGNTAVDAHGSANGANDNLTDLPLASGTVMSAKYTDALGADAKRFITDLQVTHPIGFRYQDAFDARGEKELVSKETGFIVGVVPSSATFNTNSRTGLDTTSKKIQDTLYNGFMTCASCHDVHNTLNVSDATGTANGTYNYFLYAREEGSTICLSCHVK